MCLKSAARFGRACGLTVSVALQHLGADGFLDLFDRLFPVVLVRVGVKKRADDVGVAPQVELLHLGPLWIFLFGHMIVPFLEAVMLWQRLLPSSLAQAGATGGFFAVTADRLHSSLGLCSDLWSP